MEEYMKVFKSFKFRLFFILFLSFIIIGFVFIKFRNINTVCDENIQIDTYQIDKIKSNLSKITSTPTKSSNPLDQVKGHEKEYNEILEMGETVVCYFIDEFKKGKLEAKNEWLTAFICNEILGEKNPIKIASVDPKNGWEYGGDWYEKYMKIKKIK
jgi:hypothetical protein